MKTLMLLSALSAAVLISVPAQADTVDFEELSPDTIYDSPLTSGGLTFTNDGSGGGVEGFVAVPYFGIPSSNGTIALVPNFYGSVTTVDAGGALFTLESFDWSDAFNFADDPVELVVTYTLESGDTVTSYFADFTAGMQTEQVGLSGISSFSFFARGSLFGEDTVQLDNIVYTLDATGAIPEPATWAMMIGGIGAAGGALRRRSKVRVAYAA